MAAIISEDTLSLDGLLTESLQTVSPPGLNPFEPVTHDPNDAEVMQHILQNLLSESIIDGPIADALKKAGSYAPWTFLVVEVPTLMTQKDRLGHQLASPIPLNQVAKKAITGLHDYYDYVMNEEIVDQICLTNTQWMGISHAELQDFILTQAKKLREDERSQKKGDTLASTPISPMRGEGMKHVHFDIPTTPLSQNSHAETMTRSVGSTSIKTKSILDSVKRDPNAYPELKDEKSYDPWIRGVQALAEMHQVSLVLDHDYVPQTLEDIAAFDDMQIFLWAVLVNKLKTPNGRQLVRENEASRDSQQVFTALHDYERLSMHAENNSDAAYLKLTALDLSKWPATYVSFLQLWHTSIYQWIELAAGHQDLPKDKEKKKLLRTAVCKIGVMASIATQENIDQAQHKPAWTYKVYYDLLMLTALADDHAKSRTTKTSRTTNETRQTPGRGARGGGRGGGRGRGGRFSGRGRGETGRGRGGTERVPPEVWAQLTPEARRLILSKRQPYVAKQAKIALPPALMAQLPPMAQKAINDFNSQVKINQQQQQIQPSVDTTPAPLQGEQSPLPPSSNTEFQAQPYLYEMLSSGNTQPNANEQVVIQGHTYRRVNHTRVHIRTSEHTERVITNSLIDGGANGGLGGSDVRLLETTDRLADVTGIDGHVISNIPMGTVAGKVMTTRGPIIAIWHQYAYTGKGHSIHSSHQMRDFKLDVDDHSVTANGKQRIKTLEGYIIPLDFEDGLPTLPHTVPTDEDMDSFPHVFMTSDVLWDPNSLNFKFPRENGEFEYHEALNEDPADFESFDNRVRLDGSYIFKDDGDEFAEHYQEFEVRTKAQAHIANHRVQLKDRDYESLRPCFAWLPTDVVRKTVEHSTQFFRNIFRLPMRKHLKSRHPAANVPRRHEYVAMDTFKSDTPAFMLGSKQAQLYVGRRSYVTDAYAMRSESEIPRTLEDNIRERGAPQCLVSDGAKAAISNKTKDILRLVHTKDWQSEPHNQQQNFAENRMGTVIDMVSTTMDRTGCPASMWFLILCWVCFVLNYSACKSLQWQIPIAILMGFDPDISFLLEYSFWEPVLYAVDNHFPSQSPEKTGRFVGFAHNIGDILTFRILTDDTNQIITRSVVRPRMSSKNPNRRLDPFGGEENQPVSKPVMTMVKPQADEPKDTLPPQGPLTPDELIGRSILLEEDPDGQRLKATIVRKIIDYDEATQKEIIKFLVEVPDGKMDQLRDYADLLEALDKQSETIGGTQFWNWINISGHQGPLEKKDKYWKGSKYNLLVNWETGESTFEPMTILEKDNADLVAQDGLEHGLLNEVGWKHLKRKAKNKKVLDQRVNQAKRQHKRSAPVFLYGLEVPRNPDHAAELDKANRNTKWGDSDVAELQGLFDYDFAKDDGVGDTHPAGYIKIRCRMIYIIKHDGRHKARFVEGGHLTPEPESSVYSGVVSHRSLRIIILAAELN